VLCSVVLCSLCVLVGVILCSVVSVAVLVKF